MISEKSRVIADTDRSCMKNTTQTPSAAGQQATARVENIIEPVTKTPTFRFIDLFAGIGGFHAALQAFGGECVYAVEIDDAAAKVYEKNWGKSSKGDITKDANDEQVIVPAHDVLVAGFPCQPFSKSGNQRGMEETRGTLYWNILKIIEKHHPAIVLLENVRNLAGPRHRHEWKVIIDTLREQGYVVASEPAILSPHLLPPSAGGRPQARERVFITATYSPGATSEGVEPVANPKTETAWSIEDWDLVQHLPVDTKLDDKALKLGKDETTWIDAWDDFVQQIKKANGGKRLPGFPIWADAFVETKNLSIPADTPVWKADFLTKNAALYTTYKATIDPWMKKWNVASFPPSRRKLEWQAQDAKSLWDTVLHFRPSGIRAKRPTYVPALVAITQTSIVGSLKRRLSTRETARLQGLPEWFDFGDQADSKTYKQMGNGVNVGVVWQILKRHAARDASLLKKQAPALYKAIATAPDSPDGLLAVKPTKHQQD
jgi:DNA (cytosine-5)-methyltransferase 1